MLDAYGPRAAFLSGWVTLLLGFAAPIAAGAYAAASYLLEFGGGDQGAGTRGLASALIVALTLAHASNPQRTVRIQAGITLTKLGVLLVLVVAGLIAGQGRWQGLIPATTAPSFSPMAALTGLVYVSYAYSGWNAATYIGGEIRDPRRLLPRAILGGTALVGGLYLGLNLVYALGVPVAELQDLARRQGRDAVEPIARLAAAHLFSPLWGRYLAVVIGLVLVGSLSAMLVTGPRVGAAMAEAGHLPRGLARRGNPDRGPTAATALLAAVALALLWTGSFENLVLVSGVGLGLFSLPTVAAVYVLRRARPERDRPFRVPGYPWVPAIYLVMTTTLLVAAVRGRPQASAVALGAILAGLPVYDWNEWRRRRAASQEG